ncbi:dead end protein 1-like [Paralichthys olivaceus]|uniref:dead end protein 1-like n=1 Tax=Paralichthys olivaceus TaxID=8255 RepID=UPI00097DCCCD|nr:PREDICTED: dead end protein 1-like [Paralichthys olivaceus]
MGSEAVLNLERVQALETWLETTSVKLTQVNGQRKYGGPPEVWNGPTPGARCEVFISQIPRDTYEDLLIPLFSSVGPLWEFRLMMNFSGQNRGFAYAKYGSQSVAADAIRLLNGQVLESGSCLSVRRSTEKRHLCIDNLPVTSRQEDLLQVLRVLTDGVERVSLMTRAGVEGVSAKVTFSSHQAASMAKKMLVEAFKKQFSLSVSVKWELMVKPSPDKPMPSKKPSKSPPEKNPPVKPPCHILNSPRPCSVLPPRLAHHHPSFPPGFCSTVGGPTNPLHPHLSYYSTFYSQQQLVSAASPVMLLHEACEATVAGQPLSSRPPSMMTGLL